MSLEGESGAEQELGERGSWRESGGVRGSQGGERGVGGGEGRGGCKVNVGGWYERIAVTVRLRLYYFLSLVFLGVVLFDPVNKIR